MPLPTKKTPPKRSLSDVSILLYGPSKIGKSSFAAQAPDAIFLATEPGLNALEVYQYPITSWPVFLEACAELAKGDHPFKTVVIDTIDVLYRLCADHICQKRGIEHESDGSHGKVYGLIKNEIYRVLTKLAHLPYGLILISHSQDRDLETRTGTITRTVPTLSESFRQIIIGLVDLILYCDVQVDQGEDGSRRHRRVVRTKPSPNYDAGDRFGCLPEVMDLSFDAFSKAFEKPKSTASPANANTTKSEPTAKAADKSGKQGTFSMETTGYPNNGAANLDLAQFDDDFENAEVEDRDFEEPPDGRYQVIVDKVELARSQTANNPMLKWQLKILGPQCSGRFLFRNNMIVTPENVKWLKNDLHTCGLELKKLSDLPAHLNDLLDVTLEVKKQTRGEYTNVYLQRRIQVDVPEGFSSGRHEGNAAGDALPF